MSGSFQAPLDEIAVGERLFYYHADRAAMLAERFAIDGQHTPILLRRNGNRAPKKWTLIAGLHRQRAAELRGWSTILAREAADEKSDAEALLRLQISENLDRRDLRPIERSIGVAARARLEEAADHPDHVGERPQDRANRLRWEGDGFRRPSVADAFDWPDRAAEALGCSPRTLRRYCALHAAIVEPFPVLAEQLNAHRLGDNLRELSILASVKDAAVRERVIRRVVADKDYPSIHDALLTEGEATAKTPNRGPAHTLECRRWVGEFKKLRQAEQKDRIATLLRSMSPTMQVETRRQLTDLLR